jgi:hypothetical protein
MEAQIKRCRHGLGEGTCSLCAGMPRTKDYDRGDLLGFTGSGSCPVVLSGPMVFSGYQGCTWTPEGYEFNDADFVQECACSLL